MTTKTMTTTERIIDLVRTEGTPTCMNGEGLDEMTMNFTLNRDLKLDDLTDLINENEQRKMRVKLADGLGRIITNTKLENGQHVMHDMERSLHFNDGQEIALDYNQSINIYHDSFGSIDIMMHIPVDGDLDLLVHFYLKA